MESNVPERKAKPSKPNAYSTISILKETKKRISADLARINKKDFGRTIRADEYLALAVSLVTPELAKQLQESSLSNADRLERDYRAYVSQFGTISKDEYLGKRLSGEIGNQKGSAVADTNTA